LGSSILVLQGRHQLVLIHGREHGPLLERTQSLEARQLRFCETEGTTRLRFGVEQHTETLNKRNELGPIAAVKDKTLCPTQAVEQPSNELIPLEKLLAGRVAFI
jgi:hypothetical protein